MGKIASKGAILQYENPAATWNTIPYVGDLNLANPQRERIDVTTHDSPGGFREYVDGLLGEGTLPVPLVYDPANAHHQYLQGKQATGGNVNFKLILPDAGAMTIAFTALVTKFDVDASVPGKLAANCELKTTGAITFTP